MSSEDLVVSYSPLCDTDKELYARYLDSCDKFAESRNVGFVRDFFSNGPGKVLGLPGSEGLVFGDGQGFDVGVFVDRMRAIGAGLGGVSRLVGGTQGECVDGSDTRGVSRIGGVARGGDVGSRGCEGVGASDFLESVGSEASGFEVGALDCVSESVKNGAEGAQLDLDGVGRGKNWKKNRRKKLNRRDKVVSGTVFESGVCSGDDGGVFVKPKDALRLSLEKKWALENELKAAKAARELELLKAEDLDAVKKLRERKVQGATERTMVQIEKAHASLVQTGNVPGVQPVQQGFCQTVVDGEIVESVPGLSGGESKGCSISPSSSISEREVRQMKKELEDFKARCEKAEKEKAKLRERLVAVAGLSTQKETAFSLCDGTLPGTVKDALEEVHGMENIDRSYPGPHDPDTVYLKLEYPPLPGEYNDYY